MNTIYFICLYNALNRLAINLGYPSYYFNTSIFLCNPGIFGSIKPNELDMEFVANKPKPKSPSGAAGASAIPELDEIQLVRQLLESLSESYRDANITEPEKKTAVSDAIHILSEGLIKEKINLKMRLLRATSSYNCFHLKRYLSYEFNHFIDITLDEFREMLDTLTS